MNMNQSKILQTIELLNDIDFTDLTSSKTS